MKSEDIIFQLDKDLPLYSDRFSESIGVSSLTSAALTATVVTSEPHGLANGSLITIDGYRVPVFIDTIERDECVATVVTLQDHDLTEGYQENVEISGANESEFNGSFKLLTVPNRRTFTIQVEDAGPINSTGAPQLNQETGIGYNGQHAITVVDDTTFTFPIQKDLGSPAQAGTNAKISIGFRITGAVTMQSAIDQYTEKQDSKSWAYVVLGATTASKDRRTDSDAVYVFRGSSKFDQQLIQGFTVYVISTVSDELGARKTRDDMEDVAVALYKSLVGAKLDSYLVSGAYYSIVFDNHTSAFYDKAKYVHAFSFQTVMQLTDKDVVSQDSSVAFRDITTIQSVEFMTDDTTRVITDIDLDEVELP